MLKVYSEYSHTPIFVINMFSMLHSIIQSHFKPFLYETLFLPKLRANIYLNSITVLLTFLKMYFYREEVGFFKLYSFLKQHNYLLIIVAQ